MKSKRDQAGVRTPEDVLRRINITELKEALELIEKIRGGMLVDSKLSTTSTLPVENRVITSALNTKVTTVDGKGLSTNDFSNEYKERLESNVIDLLPYVVSGMVVTNISCVEKNKRICINFTGSMDFLSDTETIILTLPEFLIPNTSRNFVALADTVVGCGIVTETGNITIKFPVAINDKIVRLSIVYDLEEVEADDNI